MDTVEDVRKRIPTLVTSRKRLVTEEDYRRLLSTISSVESVSADHVGSNVVNVYVLIAGGTPMTQEVQDEINALIERHKLLTDDVRLFDAVKVPVDVEIEIKTDPLQDAASIQSEVQTKIEAEINRMVFRDEIAPSDIYNAISQVPGLRSSQLVKLAREGQSGVGRLATQPGEVFTAGTVIVNAL